MDRRTFLRTAGATGAVAGTGGFAGCLGFQLSSSDGFAGEPPVAENRLDGVYYPTHIEGMNMAGMGMAGDYKVGVFYSYAHRFWNVNGESVERTDTTPEDDVHLMASVWDPETGQVLPETGLSVEVEKDGSLVSQEVIYPMISQPMGVHYGGNFALDGDGTYTVTVSVGGVRTRRTGAFRDRFADPADIPVEMEFSAAARDEISYRTLDNAGDAGAVSPMEMSMMPDATAPATEDLPGTVLGEVNSNDAVLVATVLEESPEGVDTPGPYLAVSARTPFNRMLIPAMGLEARQVRDGERLFSGELTRTLDPDLSYHYGAALADGTLESGDELTLAPTVWPQIARHEGYETAFGALMGGMPERTLTVE
ncbi:twin-arginine translocation signal domain-containing protein [Halobaculum marinum]|uniref:Twin-arginine translocation signal domain-containing protein n=1 Tax=Halobaculum marinum TaxID=3031996 RepID=A0ABD5WYS1_9EURY|nr:twin-arginine translocation signal domain-containing protein [Halobaculum sp. DT55]